MASYLISAEHSVADRQLCVKGCIELMFGIGCKLKPVVLRLTFCLQMLKGVFCFFVIP